MKQEIEDKELTFSEIREHVVLAQRALLGVAYQSHFPHENSYHRVLVELAGVLDDITIQLWPLALMEKKRGGGGASRGGL